MNEFEVIAEARDALGKGANRRLRRTGVVPAVMYGAGQDPVPVSLEANRLRKQMENEAFFSHILTVKVGGEESQAVVKALQRNPTNDEVIHLDLLRVSSTQELHIRVPLHFIKEDDSPGKREGGVINHLMVDVEVGCLPEDLPEYIEVDIGTLGVGESLHLTSLVLPEGVRLMALVHDAEQDQTVVTVQHPQKLEEETTEGEEEDGLDEDGAAPEDGAPPASPDDEGGGDGQSG